MPSASSPATSFVNRMQRVHGRYSNDLTATGPQKFHSAPTPRIGGVALAAALLACVLAIEASEWISPASAYGLAMLALSAIPAFAGGFGEDVTKHGISAELLGKLDTLIVSDILPNATTAKAHYVLPGCAHAEKRGSFTNRDGRVQKFMQAIQPKGDARAEWDFLHDLVYNVTGKNGFLSIEGLFNEMAKDVPAFNGLTWAGLGDSGVTVRI